MTDIEGAAGWRCFVAVPVPEDLQVALSAAVERLRTHPDAGSWRWTDAAAWHLTLAFLGPTDAARVPELGSRLVAAVSQVEAFTAGGSGAGAFPRPARAHVLWYGIGDSDGRLADLAGRVSGAVGLPAPERFRPHLTLARSRDARGSDAVALLGAARTPVGRLPVEDVVLYRSHLSRGPARYEALARAQLGLRVPA